MFVNWVKLCPISSSHFISTWDPSGVRHSVNPHYASKTKRLAILYRVGAMAQGPKTRENGAWHKTGV